MRLTVRGRLTLVYGGLFVAAGVVLLAVTYALVSQRLPQNLVINTRLGPPPGDPGGATEVRQFASDATASTLQTLVNQGAIALILVSAVTIALGWLIAGRLLQPLHRITDTARRIAEAPAAGRGLHERIALDGPRDEVKELADTFDLMLARLDSSFDGQRRFIASASHELRTPLQLNRTLLEVALEPADAPPGLRQLGSTLLAINDRHGRLIDGLLVLAQSERELTERSYVDLADIAEHVGDTAAVKAAPAPVLGNPVLLERLVQNLVENGTRYNVPDGWVRVSTATDDGTAVLTVTNSGPVVQRYEVAGLFEPFRRAAERPTAPGAGLGLSIVQAVARAHGGDVHAEARDEGGLIVTVRLPAAPA